MGEKLQAKLTVKRKDGGTKKALNREEIRKLLAWARATQPIQDYASVLFLLTSGLRAAELLSLTWADLEHNVGAWTAYFTGKGGKRVEHEIYGPAVEAVRAAFQAMFNRDPVPSDALFWTPAQAEGDIARPLAYHTLWHHIRALGKKAVEAGLIRPTLQASPHLFRRSYIMALYRSGMRIKALQKKSRHRSLDVLIAHYIDDSEPATPYLAKILEGAA
jgi:integrase